MLKWPESQRISTVLKVTQFILAAIVGIVTAIVAVWVPVIYAELGQGFALLAMLICSPAIIVMGPGFGVIGTLAGRILVARFNNLVAYFLIGIISAAIIGLVLGVLPYILLWLYSLVTGIPWIF